MLITNHTKSTKTMNLNESKVETNCLHWSCYDPAQRTLNGCTDRSTSDGGFIRMIRHVTGIVVAGRPATGQGGELVLLRDQHDRKLGLVVRIHLAAFDKGNRRMLAGRPLKAEIERVPVVTGLDVKVDGGPLAGNHHALRLLARDHFLSHVGLLALVAFRATVADLLDGAGTAMVAALQDPFH